MAGGGQLWLAASCRRRLVAGGQDYSASSRRPVLGGQLHSQQAAIVAADVRTSKTLKSLVGGRLCREAMSMPFDWSIAGARISAAASHCMLLTLISCCAFVVAYMVVHSMSPAPGFR